MKTLFKKINRVGILTLILLSSYQSLGAVAYCPKSISGILKMSNLCTLSQPSTEVPNSVVFCTNAANNQKVEALVLLWPNNQSLVGSYVENSELIPGSTLFTFVSGNLKLSFSSSSNLQTKEKFLSLNIHQKQYVYHCQK